MIEAAERAGLLRPAARSSSRRRATPATGSRSPPHSRAIAASSSWPTSSRPEKQALLRAYGAEVVLCPTNVEPESPESYYSVAARLARDIPGAFKPDQYWNIENPVAHERTTGPEIWDQTDGRITHLVASAGTGGTITGVGPLPEGAEPGDHGHRRRPGGQRAVRATRPGPYLTEGVGEDFLPGTTTRRSSTAGSASRIATRSRWPGGSPARRASSPASRAARPWSPRSTRLAGSWPATARRPQRQSWS